MSLRTAIMGLHGKSTTVGWRFFKPSGGMAASQLSFLADSREGNSFISAAID